MRSNGFDKIPSGRATVQLRTNQTVAGASACLLAMCSASCFKDSVSCFPELRSGGEHSFRAFNICGSQEKHSSEPFLGAAKSAAAGGGGSSRSPSAVRGVRSANLPLRPALAAVTITGSCKSRTLTPKLEEVPAASSKPGHAPHSFGVLHLAAGNSPSKSRGMIMVIMANILILILKRIVYKYSC